MKKYIIKIVFLVICLFIGITIDNFVSPMIQNSIAMYQMESSYTSSLWIQMYSYMSNYSFLLFVLLVVLTFYKDILKIIKKLKEKKENEDH